MRKKRTEAQKQKDRERYASDPVFRKKVRENVLRHQKTQRGRIMNCLRGSRAIAKASGYEPCSATVDEILNFSTGFCHICGADEDLSKKGGRLHVDHCHKTGLFRGLICSRCNTALGYFRDDPEVILSAFEYLVQDKSLRLKWLKS